MYSLYHFTRLLNLSVRQNLLNDDISHSLLTGIIYETGCTKFSLLYLNLYISVWWVGIALLFCRSCA